MKSMVKLNNNQINLIYQTKNLTKNKFYLKRKNKIYKIILIM